MLEEMQNLINWVNRSPKIDVVGVEFRAIKPEVLAALAKYDDGLPLRDPKTGE